VSDGELSPVCGQLFMGGLNAPVPLRGLTYSPNDVVTAYVFDHRQARWVGVGSAVTAPVPLARMDGELIYPFDMGSACPLDCELDLPIHAWGGFGPFNARVGFHSQAHGWLPAPSMTTATTDALGCQPGHPSEIVIRAAPIER
jgi:hypothetical protein